MDYQIDNELFVVSLLESTYLDLMVTLFPDKERALFIPEGWYMDYSNIQKIKILKEALEKKILITDTEEYNNNLEGVKGLR